MYIQSCTMIGYSWEIFVYVGEALFDKKDIIVNKLTKTTDCTNIVQ